MKKKVSLKDIASFSKGSQINGDLLIEDGKYEYLNGGIKPSGKWSEFNVDENTITISEGGNSCGYVNFMNEKFWCGAHCYYLFDISCKPKYLYYLLKGNQNDLMKIRSGACMPNIKKSDLGNFKFIFDDDINNQNKIIEVFDKLTEIIECYEKELKHYNELVKARFIEMFMCENCPSLSMDELSLANGEYGAGSASIEYDSSRPRYVRITDINDDGTLNDDYVSSANEEDDETYRLSYGDFLFARMGATVGKTYAYKDGNQIFAGYLIRYKLDLEKVLPEYLYIYTKLEDYKKWVELNQSGAAQPGINAKKYGTLLIPVAPLDKQKEFASFAKQVDKSKLAVQKSLEKTQQLFDSLMQEYFG